jgi:hypothetical protein
MLKKRRFSKIHKEGFLKSKKSKALSANFKTMLRCWFGLSFFLGDALDLALALPNAYRDSSRSNTKNAAHAFLLSRSQTLAFAQTSPKRIINGYW